MRFLLFSILLIFVVACEEDTRVNLIKGKIFQNCSEPLVNAELALKLNTGDPFILGAGRSTNDGSFSFTYEIDKEDEGTGDLLLIKEDGFETLLKNVELNEDITLSIYLENIATMRIDISGDKQFSIMDTLYIGTDLFSIPDSMIIQPPDTIIREIDISQLISRGGVIGTFYYGLGFQEFLKAKNAASIPDSSFQNEPIRILRCGHQTFLNLEIN